MTTLTECLGRLKWGFLPTRRIVDEINDDASTEALSVQRESSFTETEDNEKDKESFMLETRDEADRPWWRFFDEYEYRMNKYQRKAHKPWKWFDENDTKADRKLMWKIDVLLTLYSFLAYWVKYLDQTNLNNAYTSPNFKADLGMKGNDLVNTQVLFNVGNIVFCIPFMYLLYACPLNYLLPLLDICWSICTIGLSQINTVSQLKALRFFIGAFEAPSYLAYQYLFGTWISNPGMIARRSMFYYFGQYVGILTSGLLSGAIVDNLEGALGYHSWRWIFIIDGCISLAIGILGVYMIPGTPADTYSIWLSDDEIRLVRKRLGQSHVAGRPADALKSLFSPKIWREILTSWEIYVLSLICFFCWNSTNTSSGSYILWLQTKYKGGEIQYKSALTPGLGLLWLFLVSMSADLFHCRWGAIFWSQLINISGNIILAVWNVPEPAKWYAFCVSYFSWAAAPTLYSWQNDICRRDAQKRAVLLVWMNMFAQASTAWMAVIVWKTVEAPRYLKGYSWTAANAFMFGLSSFLVLYFYKRNERRHAKENGIILYNSKLDDGFGPTKTAGHAHVYGDQQEKSKAALVDVASNFDESTS
nr:Seo1 [Starmerella bombicola]